MTLSCAIFGFLMRPIELLEISASTSQNENVVKDKNLNWKLLTNPIFLLMGFCYGFGYIAMFVPNIFLPDIANLRGINNENSILLLTVIGN